MGKGSRGLSHWVQLLVVGYSLSIIPSIFLAFVAAPSMGRAGSRRQNHMSRVAGVGTLKLCLKPQDSEYWEDKGGQKVGHTFWRTRGHLPILPCWTLPYHCCQITSHTCHMKLPLFSDMMDIFYDSRTIPLLFLWHILCPPNSDFKTYQIVHYFLRSQITELRLCLQDVKNIGKL